MSARRWAAPELPERARPRWRPWHAPVALLASLACLVGVGFPLLPLILLSGAGETVDAVVLLVLILLQDLVLVGSALFFGRVGGGRPRAWHFGLRRTRFWPAAGWAVLGFGVLLGIEVGYIELFGVDETNVEDLGGDGVAAAIAVCLATIVVAPVTEELFFRSFFYRALRTRLRVWSAALIDGLVFGSLHFQGISTVEILPVIAVVGVGLCLIYEITGSVFPVIAIHAAFNTVAMLETNAIVALVIGTLVLAGCVLVPRRMSLAPSPLA